MHSASYADIAKFTNIQTPALLMAGNLNYCNFGQNAPFQCGRLLKLFNLAVEAGCTVTSMPSLLVDQEQLSQEQAMLQRQKAAQEADLAKQQAVLDDRVAECAAAEAQVLEGQFLLCAT